MLYKNLNFWIDLQVIILLQFLCIQHTENRKQDIK